MRNELGKRQFSKRFEDLNVFDEKHLGISGPHKHYKLGNQLCIILFSTRGRNTLHFARVTPKLKEGLPQMKTTLLRSCLQFL